MTTRRAKEDSPFRQERYASSAQYERGLLANLVAQRCSLVADYGARGLFWFLQACSHEDGGLERVAADLVEKFPGHIGTATMLKLNLGAGQKYRAAQLRKIREELPWDIADGFLLHGERSDTAAFFGRSDPDILTRPKSYAAADLREACVEAAGDLADYLRELCLNPGRAVEGPWYFAGLIDALDGYRSLRARQAAESVPVTAAGAAIHEALDYAYEERCVVRVTGRARMGKSVAARQWCRMHPGVARYIEVPSTNDDIALFRRIAKGLGVSAGHTMKAGQIRERIEDTLHGGDIILVLDEGHYLFSQHSRVRSFPRRVNWVMTALANYDVPCAIVATPQFDLNQKAVEKNTHWASEQLDGRISLDLRLPETVSAKDMEAVARHLLPGVGKEAVGGLVVYAQSSSKYLAAIESAVKRARFLARKAGRAVPSTADVRDVVREAVASDVKLRPALSRAGKKPRRGGQKDFSGCAAPMQSRRKRPAEALPGKPKAARTAATVHTN